MRGQLGKNELRLNQWHHAYLGLLIILADSFLFQSRYITVGWIILIDDLLQHLIQWLYEDSYHSPLRVLYEKWIWEPLHKT